jgi:hypothetical protein
MVRAIQEREKVSKTKRIGTVSNQLTDVRREEGLCWGYSNLLRIYIVNKGYRFYQPQPGCH